MIILKTVSKKQQVSWRSIPVVLVLLLWGIHDLHACESATPRRFIDLLTNMEFSGAESYLQQWEQREARLADLGFYRAMILLARGKASSGDRREQLQQRALDELLKWVDENTGASMRPSSMLTIGLAKAFIARIYLEQGVAMK